MSCFKNNLNFKSERFEERHETKVKKVSVINKSCLQSYGPVVHKVCSANPKESINTLLYSSLKATLKFIYYFIK
jgi:hypothetical protein